MQTLQSSFRQVISKQNIFFLVLLSFAFISMPSSADENNLAEVDLHLSRDCIGEYCELYADKPTKDKPRYWVAQNDPPIQNEYYALSSWELNFRGPVAMGDSYDASIWVESTNVQEISFYATLYIRWLDYSEDPSNPKSRVTNISEIEVSESAGFGQVLNENYTIEYEGAEITDEFPDGIPAYSTIGYKLETRIRWAPDTDNNTAWIKSDSIDFDSYIKLNIRHVDIEEDTGYFVNDRVDEINGDSLFIKVNVSNALSAENFDMNSAELSIQGVSGGGNFENSVEIKDKHAYAVYVQGVWSYQKDQNINGGLYTILISIKDIYGNIWRSQVDYDLVVDEFGLEIEFVEPYSPNGQLPKGGKVDYEFRVYNRGNTRDIFDIELDDSDLPSSWSASLVYPVSPSSLDLTENQHGTVKVRVEVPVSVIGGSKESLSVKVQSSSSSNIMEEIDLETTVRIYGAAFVSSPDEVIIDPEEIDTDGTYRFSVNLRNTGSDRDTFTLSAGISGWPEPIIEVEADDGSTYEVGGVTLEKSQTEKIFIVLKPVNYEQRLGEAKSFNLAANSISPGDGSANIRIDIIVDVPIDRLIDLSVNSEDILVNNKPLALLSDDDISAEEPIKIQVLITNNGGQSTGAFGVKLYVGQRVEDEVTVQQGIRGFGTETVLLTWSSPYPGPITLRVKVDGELQTAELQGKRSDNIEAFSFNVAEETSGGGSGSSSDDSLLIGPSYFLTAAVLLGIAVIRHRKQ